MPGWRNGSGPVSGRPVISWRCNRLTVSRGIWAPLPWLAGGIATALAGCTTLPPVRRAPVDLDTHAGAAVVAGGSATLDVLTFNIEGLGWPARRNRAPFLRRIGARLAELNAKGEAPDVVLVQEMFSPAAVSAMTKAGYPYQAWGPSRTQKRRRPAPDAMAGPFRWKKGETGLHLVGSGLAILSRYPIVADASEPFGKHRCAGFDCLSNKGMQQVRIRIPGVPQPVDIFNTHLNSQGASRVPAARSGAAHAIQVDDLAGFVAAAGEPKVPTILGGDFNMRGAPERLARFDAALDRLTMVHRFCAAPASPCAVRVSWDGDAPWMDTEDLQLFADGARVRVTPIRVEAMFDGAASGPQLSDHDGFRVTYRLDW